MRKVSSAARSKGRTAGCACVTATRARWHTGRAVRSALLSVNAFNQSRITGGTGAGPQFGYFLHVKRLATPSLHLQ